MRLDAVMAIGGEGLMLQEPKSAYVPRRSKTTYNVQTFVNADAEVIRYERGKGRNVGCYWEESTQLVILRI
jgi:ATP-dependent DNA ligase